VITELDAGIGWTTTVIGGTDSNPCTVNLADGDDIAVTFTNTYTPCEEGTAWGVIMPIDTNYDFDTGNAQYFTYNFGSSSDTNPTVRILGVGANYIPVGTVKVWDDGNKIYVKFETSGTAYMTETHLYVGLIAPTKSAPGRLGFAYENGSFNEHTYQLDKIYENQMPPTGPKQPPTISVSNLSGDATIFIAAHAVIKCDMNE